MKKDDMIQPEDVDKELEALMSTDGNKKDKKRRRGGRMKKILFAVVAVVAVGAIGIKVMGSGKTQIMTVGTVSPVKKDIQSKLSVSGPVSGTDSVDVVSNLHAEVSELPVKEGDKVEKGQLLAVLDETDAKKEADIAKNAYDLAVSTYNEKTKEAKNGYAKALQDYQAAKVDFDRRSALYAGGSVPKVELESAENAKNDARRNLESYTLVNGEPAADESYRLQIENAKFSYEKKLELVEDARILSPISGTIVRVNTKVGQFADKVEDDKPMFSIENLDVLEMEIKISEYSIGKVRVGQEAVIKADILNGETVRGEVMKISPTGEEKGGGSTERVIPTTVRILDRNTRLIAGITAKAEIVLEETENALTVPVSALLSQEDNTYVLTVKDGLIHWAPVQTGVESDIETEVIPAEGETLDESSQIVASPHAGLTEGMAVAAMAQ